VSAERRLHTHRWGDQSPEPAAQRTGRDQVFGAFRARSAGGHSIRADRLL